MDFGIFGELLKYAFIAYLTVSFTRIVYTQRNLVMDAYRFIEWRMFGLVLLTIILVVFTSVILLTVGPGFMSWSWFDLFGSEGSNVVSIGLRIKFFGVLFCLLFMAALPVLALREEEMFREGTKTWGEGIWRSLLFGLIHMIMGVPLGIALAISILGLMCTREYFRGGVERSTQFHFQYNLVLVSLAFISVILLLFV